MMLRGVKVELPEVAQVKLQDLNLARDAALDSARGAIARLQQLPRDADQQMHIRLAGERDKHNHKHGQLSRLLSATNQWLMELRGVVLEPAPSVKIELKNGETLNAALNSARTEITALRQQLQGVRSAPLPVEDQKRLAVEYIAGLLRTARPTIGFQRDALTVTWRDDIVTSRTDVLALLAWVNPEVVLTALEREIDQQPTHANAMPRSERLKRVAELEEALDKLERAEQALIERAIGDGLDLPQRPDASPAAFLGVVVIKAQAQQQVA